MSRKSFAVGTGAIDAFRVADMLATPLVASKVCFLKQIFLLHALVIYCGLLLGSAPSNFFFRPDARRLAPQGLPRSGWVNWTLSRTRKAKAAGRHSEVVLRSLLVALARRVPSSVEFDKAERAKYSFPSGFSLCGNIYLEISCNKQNYLSITFHRQKNYVCLFG